MQSKQPDVEARLAFWAAAYLVVLHRGAPGTVEVPSAKQQADKALREFDAKAKELTGPQNQLG